jgi:hypothetical protein
VGSIAQAELHEDAFHVWFTVDAWINEHGVDLAV